MPAVAILMPPCMQAMTVLACGAWMGVSSALILVNKHCMSDDGFAYPMALSGLGMAFSGIASTVCCKVSLRCTSEVWSSRDWHTSNISHSAFIKRGTACSETDCTGHACQTCSRCPCCPCTRLAAMSCCSSSSCLLKQHAFPADKESCQVGV